MKKIVRYTLGTVFLIAVCQLTACHKLFDIIKHHDGGPSPDTLCRITQMTSYGYATPDTNTLYFRYNAQGNPDSAVPPASLKTVKPTYLFRYNADGKLSEILKVIFYDTTSGNGFVPTYTSYSWTGNRITYSSMFYAGAYYNGQVILDGPSTITLYEYDSLDRIVKTRTKAPFTPEVEQPYTYNAAGNSSAYASYDNKINLLRTHKLWMFLARDYSKNNPLTNATYNWMGLPVTTHQSTGRYLLPGGTVTPDHATIAYSCQH